MKAILKDLDNIGLNGAYIDKIELAAFAIRGKRTARWLIPTDHPEYATLENSLGAAKKLTWLLLKSEEAPGITAELYNRLRCVQTFNRNGRTDPYSIQMGHLVPLSRAPQRHKAKNVIWAHRRCNYIQDEQTVEETIKTLQEIVRKHSIT